MNLRRRESRAFTLAELLVVIGVIAILGTLTVVSVQRISRDTRTATATNTVTNALAAARAHAIKTNNLVMVVFLPTWDPSQRQTPQQTQVLVAEWTGESLPFEEPEGSGVFSLADRFVPANGFPSIRLPPGVKVAGPLFEVFGSEGLWTTQAELPRLLADGGWGACSERNRYYQQVGVMFGPDGSRLSRNPLGASADNKSFVDLNGNRLQDGTSQATPCANSGYFPGSRFWLQDERFDECNVVMAPFVAVYDDRAARDRRTGPWDSDAALVQDLVGTSGYISTNSDRIHFNRYTGVAEVIAP